MSDNTRTPSPRLVIIESPYAGDVASNITYARECVRDSLLRGEAPIASHLLYTQDGILNDDLPNERAHGITAGLAWRIVADASVVYTDLGISRGMEYGIEAAKLSGKTIEYRSIRNAIEAYDTPSSQGGEKAIDYKYVPLGDLPEPIYPKNASDELKRLIDAAAKKAQPPISEEEAVEIMAKGYDEHRVYVQDSHNVHHIRLADAYRALAKRLGWM